MEFSFAQNPVVEDINVVPESFRAAYVEKEGKFEVNPQFAGLTSALDGLSGALKKERDAGKVLKGQPTAASVLEALGFPDVDAAKAKFDELTNTVAERAKVDPAKIRKEIEDTFTTKEQGYKTQLTDMEGTLFEHLVQNTARGALAEHKGNELFLMPHIERSTKVVKDETTGKYVVRVVDAEGAYRGDGKGGFMGVTDLVGELKGNKSFAGAFESDQNPGGGRPNATPNRGAIRQAVDRNNQGEKTGVSKIASGLNNLQRA
jgi:hypothetical protein